MNPITVVYWLRCRAMITAGVLLLAAPCLPIGLALAGDPIPPVDFAVFRLDWETLEIEHAYRFDQPQRKTLPGEFWERYANVYYYATTPGDFGELELESRLTGETILDAVTEIFGGGTFVWPDDSLETAWADTLPVSTAPDTLMWHETSDSTSVPLVWDAVRRTTVAHELAATHPFHVFVIEQRYCCNSDWEWFVVVHTVPPAPLDVAISEIVWPRALVTRNVPNVPEVRVDNFSDAPVSARVEVAASDPSGVVYESIREVVDQPADAGVVIHFDELTPQDLDDLHLAVSLAAPAGGAWTDTFADNDTASRTTSVTEQPVFRPVSSIRRGGPIPMDGKSVDFDGDGDPDVVVHSSSPEFWRNDGDMTYTDVTHLTQAAFPPHPRLYAVGDMTGNGYPDLLLGSYTAPAVLIEGDGTGAFEDVTPASGLALMTTGGVDDVDPLDLEDDGDVDLLISANKSIVLAVNDGSGHFVDEAAGSDLGLGRPVWSTTVGRLDDDGLTDVIVNTGDPPSAMFRNDGDGTFSQVPAPWSASHFGRTFLFDHDADHRADVFFVGVGAAFGRHVYRNLGSFEFKDISASTGDLGADHVPAFANVNGEPRPEMIQSDLSAQLSLYVQESGAFAERSELLVDMEDHWLAGALGSSNALFTRLVDLDADGDLDVYSAMVAFLNQGRDPTTVVAVPSAGDAPLPVRTLRLGPASPNPFSSNAAMRIHVPSAGRIQLSIYDVAGRHVVDLLDEVRHPGEHFVTWRGRDDRGVPQPAGIYFLRLASGNGAVSRKIVLTR